MSDLAATALLCRTSDRTPEGALGAVALSELAGARQVGSPATPQALGWKEDLVASRGCLLEAGGQVDDALTAGRFPLLFAGDCSIAVSTLPVVVRHRPDAWICWIDAHADFNTPDTSPSGFLGGMPLAAACGLWDSGFGAGVDPARVAMLGVRDVDGGERVLLDTHGVGRPEGPEALADLPVFVHLDLDVLDPMVLPATFPSPQGWSFEELQDVLEGLAAGSEVIGLEVTSAHPAHVEAIWAALQPLVDR
ncbi:MAG: arginase family protein [Solirubrobacterales bacterium]|nr:arginase family protein [Solirubrobacterales bacterium]